MVRCELCGRDVMEKAGVFTEWTRTTKGRKHARIRGTRILHYEPSADRRKAHVYCRDCRKRINRVLDNLRFY